MGTVATKIDAIAVNPEVWRKTVFILCYDENDGIFDHVAPPTPPPGTPSEYIDGLPIGAGFRVPCVLVSPWTAGGWVCSDRFDHTSSLRLLEQVTGVAEPNISAWRRQTFGDFPGAFRFDAPAQAAPRLTETVADLNRAHLESGSLPAPVLPGADQAAPRQEAGARPRVPRSG